MRKLFRRECGTCGKEIWRDAAHLRPINFCSFACRNIHSHKGKSVPENVRRQISQTLTGRKGAPRPDVRERRGEKHPRWKGDAVSKNTARHRAQNRYPLQPCEVCGKEPGGTPRIERHHRDGNTHNNEPSNIAFLCDWCHDEAHRQMKAQV